MACLGREVKTKTPFVWSGDRTKTSACVFRAGRRPGGGVCDACGLRTGRRPGASAAGTKTSACGTKSVTCGLERVAKTSASRDKRKGNDLCWRNERK